MPSEDLEADFLGIAQRIMDKARQRSPEEERREQLSRAREEQARIAAVLEQDGVPARLRRRLSDLDHQTLSMRAVSAFDATQGRQWALVLSGRPGVGKTFAAAWWLRCQIERSGRKPSSKPFRTWWTAADFARVSAYGDTLGHMERCPYLVLDDLGAEYLDPKGHYLNRLDSLIDARYSNDRRTVVTTNLNRRDFAARYGERVNDRLHDGGRYVEMNEPTRRKFT